MEKPEVVILCGGKGSRLSEETVLKPRPMVEIGGRPILWHIMKIRAHYKHHKFILAPGYKGESIKRYFHDYRIMSVDLTLPMHPDESPQVHNLPEDFLLTYGDGVADINTDDLYKFRASHAKIGTVTAVGPPSRFGELVLSGEKVTKFEEEPQLGTQDFTEKPRHCHESKRHCSNI